MEEEDSGDDSRLRLKKRYQFDLVVKYARYERDEEFDICLIDFEFLVVKWTDYSQLSRLYLFENLDITHYKYAAVTTITTVTGHTDFAIPSVTISFISHLQRLAANHKMKGIPYLIHSILNITVFSHSLLLTTFQVES
ncbi:hypothetical protein L2E82_27220 [Cichorium intybus]|uniref:Uncharacterized protein n=1 Tax=Cichorium intybus TaxID=13427 RepID=A0ACB9CSE2_CICIN|nr:hypothetical protein L2E82_27220 [Cichorium intybus]